ncbi:hypothetical protein M441DRAFT_393474 [Trichoderma asperellum CBS 433.97]|uniref:Uncharacterized protein n=1 Tax=Trichoderma asperellum (strain ATCC 204424 / CBS 433.97 / NBRC 101777) TaxID=1042311 RepID=A0A2T3ZCX7_TRIA4|nr:hypothetical protein M441DRAFT_393474 [Trichoderma asperellum CBS 433.97]PTB42667.1 hypothetical protein M441DRAFT_393474 [Trichoderma asperellum CBS 433.97]
MDLWVIASRNCLNYVGKRPTSLLFAGLALACLGIQLHQGNQAQQKMYPRPMMSQSALHNVIRSKDYIMT